MGHRYLTRNFYPYVDAPSGWTPASLPNLLAWYDASNLASITSSSGAVSQWNDLSGSGLHLIQATGANQPSTGVDTMNGLNTISFNGSTNWMRVTTPSEAVPLTIFSVAKNTGATTGIHHTVFSFSSDGRIYQHNTGNISMYAGITEIQSGTAWGITAHQTVLYLNTASSKLYVDGGGTPTTGDPGTNPTASTFFTMGGTSIGNELMSGDISELAFCTGDQTASLTSWNTYCAKWGL